MSKQGIKLPFFRHTPINEFDKNANSVYGRVYLFYIVLFGDKRSLRFLCVNFGWRTFLFLGGGCYIFKYKTTERRYLNEVLYQMWKPNDR